MASFLKLVGKELGLKKEPNCTELADRKMFGLAISGGGIRSATFALGVLQILAARRLLKHLDYLSTVSGGGYIGSWLSAWISRAQSEGQTVGQVEELLIPPPDRPPEQIEHKNFRWLRRYGKFLAPDTSLLSADTWLIGAIWLRNTFLNLLLMMFLLSAVMLIPWTFLAYYHQHLGFSSDWPRGIVALGTAIAVLGLRSKRGDLFGVTSAALICTAAMFHILAIGVKGPPNVFSALAVCFGSPNSFASFFCTSREVDSAFISLGISALLGLLLGLYMMPAKKGLVEAPARLLLCVATAAFGVAGIEQFIYWICTGNNKDSILIPMMGPQLITLLYGMLVSMVIGLTGRRQPDELREWWSRVGAWMGIFGLAGLVLSGLAIVGPVLLFFLRSQLSLAIATGSIWAIATAAGVLLGKGPETAGHDKTNTTLADRLLPLAPIIFITGFLVLAATGVYLVVLKGGIPDAAKPEQCFGQCPPVYITPSFAESWQNSWTAYSKAVIEVKDPLVPFRGFCISVFLFLFFSRLFDINEFSLHRFYRNRLVRAYQGASRQSGRHADPFTNIDPDDDLPIRKLPDRPIHLVNTAVNLNLASAGLDERRSASFVFTRHGCGYTLPFDPAESDPKNKKKTFEYYREYPDGSDLRLGTPITISGAAASPNMGSHTSGPVAFLLTLFNVRLGFWMFNTAPDVTFVERTTRWVLGRIFRKLPVAARRLGRWRAKTEKFLKGFAMWSPVGPTIGTFYYLSELFALASGRRKYVYLSDGGHFENLAVYELLRRRCKYIICIDGEEDAGMKFEGLGELIRKARADLGVDIDVSVSNIEERSEEGFSHRHCAVANIRYPDREPNDTATLLYLKLSVTGDEPVDVLHYRKLNPQFPHQSTGDQFFSESQFESYRALGFHVAETVFRPIEVGTSPNLKEIFANLHNFWTGVPNHLDAKFTASTEAFMRMVENLRTDQDLWYLNSQFGITGWPVPAGKTPLAGIPVTDPEYSKGFYYCQQVIQLMENVYFDLDLEANYEHPAFSGWLQQFRRWKQSPMFQHTYMKTADTFSYLFCSFYERRI